MWEALVFEMFNKFNYMENLGLQIIFVFDNLTLD